MSTRQFRSDVTALVEALGAKEFPNVKIFYENGPEPDESTVGDTWVDVELAWHNSNLRAYGGGAPPMRHTGDIFFMIYTREGLGSAAPDKIVDSLLHAFARRRIGGGYTTAPRRASSTNLLGWHKDGVYVPFILDEG